MGLTGRTLVVVTGDHGEGLGAHGEAMHGVLLYDATTHIPMIVAGPGVRAGATVGTPASLVDLMPTILAATGSPAPAGLDGVSLMPTLRGETPADATRAVYVESLYAFHHYGWAPQRALVTDTHKLVDSSRARVYARGDEHERANLADAQPALRDELLARVRAMADAMTPAGTAESVALSAERVAQLEALGYLSGNAGADLAAPDLADPEERLPVLKEVERARQAFQRGELDEARARIEGAVATDPGLHEPRMMLATIHLRQGRPEEAEAVLRALDAEQPGSQTKTFLGALAMARGRPAEALALYEASLEIDPWVAGAWAAYLHALYATGDPARLAAAVERARAHLPDNAVVLGMQGLLAFMRGDPAAADLLDTAIAMDPHQPFVHHARGVIAQRAGDAVLAEALLEEELAFSPPAVPTRRALVELYAGQKRYAEQLAQLDAVIAAGAGQTIDLHARAQALFNLKRWPEAKAAVDACLAAAPSHAGCTLLDANVLKKLGREDEALAAFSRAQALAGP
jgi:tetratricopeptide (TPR) repeat protein